jgi:hypothetical protein
MKKVLLSLTFILVAFSCQQIVSLEAPEALEATSRGVLGGSKVDLYKVGSESFYIYHGVSGLTRSFYIVVSDDAYDKEVNLVHEMEDGEWDTFPATYVKDLPDGEELWVAKINRNYGWSYTGFSDLGDEFVLNYTVNGQTYWDNNGGANYTAAPYYIREGLNLGFSHLRKYSSFTGEVIIRNLAYNKSVNLIWTDDNWATTKVQPAFYYQSVDGTDLEVWTFSAFTYNYNADVEFALSYEVNGQTYWDNNFGANYTK